jgi:hypothetical protein
MQQDRATGTELSVYLLNRSANVCDILSSSEMIVINFPVCVLMISTEIRLSAYPVFNS